MPAFIRSEEKKTADRLLAIRWAAEGRTQQEIGDHLGIHQATVSLDLSTVRAPYRPLVRRGLITEEEADRLAELYLRERLARLRYERTGKTEHLREYVRAAQEQLHELARLEEKVQKLRL